MPRKQVTIQVKYPLASLPAKWEGELAPVLCHRNWAGAHWKFYWKEKGRLVFHAGLVSRVRAHFEQQGIRARTKHQRPYVPEGLPGLFAGAYTPEAWIDALREHPCGLILIDQSRSAPSVLARCVNSLPGANVIVVAPTKQEAERLARHAGRSTWRPIQLEADFRVRQRVLFTHPSIYQMCQDEVGEWNVAIFTEPSAAISRASHEQLRLGSRIRRYCLVPQSQALRPYEHLCLEAVCGVPILDTREPDRSRVGVCVLFVAAPATSIQRPVSPSWAAKRQWYWHNASRNAYIAQLAQALRQGHKGDLRRLLGAQVVNRCHALLVAGKRSTTILVENEEHLKPLTQLLPDWLPRTAANDPEIPAVTGFGGSIATMLAATRNGLRSRVVIRADGGAGWDEQIDYPPLGWCVPSQEVLLLDVVDQGHPSQRQAVDARRYAYASYGWRCVEGSIYLS